VTASPASGLVTLDDYVTVVGRVTLNEIVRGPFQPCHLGHWLSSAANGRGLATAAVRDIVRVAFGELGLHRIQAGTLIDNVRSQRFSNAPVSSVSLRRRPTSASPGGGRTTPSTS
jgi:RimJ/RimL family protein N-acetyltransferase